MKHQQKQQQADKVSELRETLPTPFFLRKACSFMDSLDHLFLITGMSEYEHTYALKEVREAFVQNRNIDLTRYISEKLVAEVEEYYYYEKGQEGKLIGYFIDLQPRGSRALGHTFYLRTDPQYRKGIAVENYLSKSELLDLALALKADNLDEVVLAGKNIKALWLNGLQGQITHSPTLARKVEEWEY